MTLLAQRFLVIDRGASVNLSALANMAGTIIEYTGNAPVVTVHDPILQGVGWDANGAPEELYTGETFEWVMREVGT